MRENPNIMGSRLSSMVLESTDSPEMKPGNEKSWATLTLRVNFPASSIPICVAVNIGFNISLGLGGGKGGVPTILSLELSTSNLS